MTTPAKPLTARQQKIYAYIRKQIERGLPPTFRGIGAAFDIASPNGVACHLRALERKGYIERDANLARGIRLTRRAEGIALLTEELIRTIDRR